MLEKINAITKEVIGLDLGTVDMDTCLADMNIDSMDAVELFLAFEAAFDIEMPDDFAPETVRDIVAFVEEAAATDDMADTEE